MPVPPGPPAGGGSNNPPEGDNPVDDCMCCIHIQTPFGTAMRQCLDMDDANISPLMDANLTPQQQCESLKDKHLSNGSLITEATFLGCPDEEQDKYLSPQDKCFLLCHDFTEPMSCCDEEGNCLGIIDPNNPNAMTAQECLAQGGAYFPIAQQNVCGPESCEIKCCVRHIELPQEQEFWSLDDIYVQCIEDERIYFKITWLSLPDPDRQNLHHHVVPPDVQFVQNLSSAKADANFVTIGYSINQMCTSYLRQDGLVQIEDSTIPLEFTLQGTAAMPTSPCNDWIVKGRFAAESMVVPFAPVPQSFEFELIGIWNKVCNRDGWVDFCLNCSEEENGGGGEGTGVTGGTGGPLGLA